MLKIKTKQKGAVMKRVVALFATVFLFGGAYVLSLVGAPAVAPLIVMKPINVNALPAPTSTQDRIIIPKIGVNIAYAPGQSSLDKGAQWRYPERGNPEMGGNFIIAAHRFSIQPTPFGTIEKSPFYNVDKLTASDKIVIDYKGTRYGYEISSIKSVQNDTVEIEAPSEDAKLTLYSCELDGSSGGRVVLVAKPLGKVAVSGSQSTD
jgi:sortase A